MDKWILDVASAKAAEADITDNQHAMKKWEKFKTVVVKDPFYHPKAKRIEKLKTSSYPDGTYRYKDEPLRVVYYPEKSTKTVYPLATGTATSITYKKRSKK